jgi:hypothetical protein
LTSGSDAVAQVCSNKRVDRVCCCTDDAADESKDLTSEHHPLSAKDITESSDEQESNTASESPGGRDPVQVGAWANVLIDEKKSVGW